MGAVGGVDRVRGLAIALGVGAAVATGGVGVSGVAAAAPADESSSSVDSPAAAPSDSATRVPSRGVATHRAERKPVARQRNDAPKATTGAAKPISLPPVGATDSAPVRLHVDPAEGVQPARSAPAGPEPASAAPALPPVEPAALPVVVRAAATTLTVAPVVGTLQPLPAPSGSSGPGSPAQTTADWLVLAAVRRTGRQSTVSPAAATVSTGQPVKSAATAGSKFSNRTPTLAPTQTAQGPAGEIAGNLNATDADGDPLTYSVTTNPTHGTLTLDTTGGFLYTPDKASVHNGVTDNFTVTVSDAGAGTHFHGFQGLLNFLTRGRLGSSGHTATRTVTLNVAPVNAAPTATASVGTPDPATGVVKGQVIGSDADADPLSYKTSATPAKGSVVVGPDGSFSYTPTAAARHTAASLSATAADRADSFTVTVADGHGGSVSVAVAVVIGPDNLPPTASSNVGAPNVVTGVVTGAVIGSDPNGDPLSYSLFQPAAKGAVNLAADGSFTYTPTPVARHIASLPNSPQANATDSFTVTVSDGNGGSTDVPVNVAVSPATISFVFTYGSGSQYWTDPVRAALQNAATRLASFIVVNQPVTLTYDVTGDNTPGNNLLANAFAAFSSSSPGYYGTVVQTKIISATDTNGGASDSQITVNFAYPWALGDTVPNNQIDFQSVAMHELVHTFGFITGMSDPSSIDRNWTTFDRYLAAPGGVSPIGSDYVWNAAYTPNLTGGNGGLFFVGPNAKAAYGGPVPLYTPSTWASGSSLTHLAPGSANCLMDPSDGNGPGVRALTPVEVGIMTDLGYTLYQGPFFAVFLLVRLRRRKPDRPVQNRRSVLENRRLSLKNSRPT